MACQTCAQRRKKLLEAKRAKKAEGKRLQAAALGAVIAVTGAVGKALNINGEVEDERQTAGDDHTPGE